MCRVFKVEGNMLFREQSLFSRYKSTDIEHIVGEKVYYCYVRVSLTRKSDEDPVAPKSVDVFWGRGVLYPEDFSRFLKTLPIPKSLSLNLSKQWQCLNHKTAHSCSPDRWAGIDNDDDDSLALSGLSDRPRPGFDRKVSKHQVVGGVPRPPRPLIRRGMVGPAPPPLMLSPFLNRKCPKKSTKKTDAPRQDTGILLCQ